MLEAGDTEKCESGWLSIKMKTPEMGRKKRS
jgi:hypothetical protein